MWAVKSASMVDQPFGLELGEALMSERHKAKMTGQASVRQPPTVLMLMQEWEECLRSKKLVWVG